MTGMDSTACQEVLDAALTQIHSCQHTSPKRLGDPGPDPGQIEKILGAAGAAPDHGLLTPSRLIIIPPQRRHLLGKAFAEALAERDGAATGVQKQEARAKASRGPFLALVLARLDPELGTTHPQERIISAGCAIQRMPLAGAMPDVDAARTQKAALSGAQLADLPRAPGLYCASAYASRGLVWAALAGEMLASLIEGEPLPLERDLADALDPGRFALKQARHAKL